MRLTYLDLERLIHGLKTAFACLIGFVITKFFHFYVDQWLIITIIVVMCAQLNVGSMIEKSYMRFLGTLSGSIFAVLVLKLFGQNEIIFALSIAVSVMIFSYIATSEKSYNESGTLGAATVVIILISKDPSVFTAIERFIEITVGIVLAALISQFILPIHARKHLRELQAVTIRQLREFFLTSFQSTTFVRTTELYQKLDENIVLSLIKQRKLAVDSAREPLGKVFNQYLFQQLLQTEKELFRYIISMQHAYEASITLQSIVVKEEVIQTFQEDIAHILDTAAKYIETDHYEGAISFPNVEILKQFIFSQKEKSSREETVYLFAYLFSAEQLVAELNNLLRLITPSLILK